MPHKLPRPRKQPPLQPQLLRKKRQTLQLQPKKLPLQLKKPLPHKLPRPRKQPQLKKPLPHKLPRPRKQPQLQKPLPHKRP